MKSNKFWSVLMMLILLLGIAVSFSSCGGDDDDTKEGTRLKGMWAMSNSGFSTYNVIEFVNDNTLYKYGNVTTDKNAWSGKSTSPVPNHAGWYYLPVNKKLYTYVLVDNKLLISDETILTYMNGKLYYEGSSNYYSPW